MISTDTNLNIEFTTFGKTSIKCSDGTRSHFLLMIR